MSGKALLDTNAVIAFFANDPSIQKLLSEMDAVFVPVIVLGELYFGANKSSNVTSNIARIDDFIAHCPYLPCDALTSQHYGRIKNALKRKGQPIPENDIWIAALAQQHDLVVISQDSHFAAVDGLSITAW